MTTRYKSYIFISFLFATTALFGQNNSQLRLWYDKPASNWNEALPIGNGRLAAMIYGNAGKEQLQLNEETVWAGEPGNNNIENVYDSIVLIRKLLFEGKYKEAQDLSNRAFPRNAPKNANYGMQYQPVGNLFVRFPGHETVNNYYRDLDIQNAIASVTYEVNGVKFKREILASLADGVIILRLTADKPKSINCEISVSTLHQPYAIKTRNKQLILTGTSSSADNKSGKIQFEAQIQSKIEGGKLGVSDTSLILTDADAATIYISIGTNYKNYRDITGDPSAKATKFMTPAFTKTYSTLKADHNKYYRKYFDRVSLDLGTTDQAKKPTNIRIAEFNSNPDPQLVSLYFQFGRYLMISGSLKGSQPTTLQGKWNDRMNPPWDSKYTININTEMNYWPAESTNLSEFHQPLFDMIKDLSITGRESASKMYHARGWVAHHNTDLWRISGPVDGGFYGMWPMGGAWLSQHLWYHYLYTADKNFLKEVYPIFKQAATFYVDVLQEEPTNKWLVVAPSMSPENSYQNGVALSAGTTMDNQLVFDVFSNCIKAAAILNVDKAFVDTVKSKLNRLPPMQIGQHGQLQEWLQDWDRPDDKHRHISHLYGLFPGNQISPYKNPDLVDAARVSLINRGDVSTGWSMGWKVNWWARLQDGNRAYKLISDQLTPAIVEAGERGGTYANLFDAHPPFQIDGNFGCTSGIAEMLVQSQDGAIHILPALPDQWANGTVKGLVTRGGFVIDITWKDHKIASVKILSKLGGNCRIRVYDELNTSESHMLKKAQGKNSNLFFETAEVKNPIISPKAEMNKVELKKVYEYDISTQAGKIYIFAGE